MPKTEKRSMSWLLRYLKPVKGRLALLLIMLLTSTGLQLLNPQIIKRFIDTAASGESSPILFSLQEYFWLLPCLINSSR